MHNVVNTTNKSFCQSHKEMDSKKKKKEEMLLVAADTLIEVTVLERQQNDHQASRRSAGSTREAHPRSVHSVHSTKRPDDPAPRAPEPISSSTSLSPPQVVSSAGCRVSRQKSSPVDLPSPSPRSPACSASLEHEVEAFLLIEHHHTTVVRPEGLPLRGETGSSCSVATPSQETSVFCSCMVASGQLVSSYPPPTRLQPSCNCSARQPIAGDAQRALAKQIAQRLIQIGDQVTLEVDTLSVAALQDQIMTSMTHSFSWRTVIQLYRALSRLLSESLNQNIAESDAWRTFEELWKTALQVMVSWVSDHGGWSAFLLNTSDDCFESSSAPNSASYNTSGRSHRFPSAGEACQYYTPQTHRRQTPHSQSSPSMCNGGFTSTPLASSGEKGSLSRVFSVNEEGKLDLEGICDDCFPAGEGEGDMGTEDHGIEFQTHSGSQSSVGSEGYSSPDANANNSSVGNPSSSRPSSSAHPTSLQPRPQSSSVLPEAVTPTPESSMAAEEDPFESAFEFDRGRSLSLPPGRRRPRSASHSHRRDVQSVMEGGELCSSIDSGLAATCSNTSLGSIDSLQFNTLGVSAICIFQAVKSMLDHDE